MTHLKISGYFKIGSAVYLSGFCKESLGTINPKIFCSIESVRGVWSFHVCDIRCSTKHTACGLNLIPCVWHSVVTMVTHRRPSIILTL